MPPKLSTAIAWQQAEQLMQPTLIRVIDNIRKQLETSDWQGEYDNSLEWPPQTSEAVKARVLELQTAVTAAETETDAIAIGEELAQLPRPKPLYSLHLTRPGQAAPEIFDLWELCYEVCFQRYDRAAAATAEVPVEVDTTLFDAETGEVDWFALDDKVKVVIGQIFHPSADH